MSDVWVDVGSTGDLNDDEPLSVVAGRHRIGVYLHRGDYYAVDNVCPHAFAILTDGFYDDGTIECPLHHASFDVATGDRLGGPAPSGLACFAVRREGDRLLVRLPEGAE